ncbi:fimbrial protein [Pseudomonas chlororaphis]|uniref:fimbrial protein n=1 Tax=Pseudomonas chlororaphis TaxID=587753 RepID=UPI0006A6585D|nr:fimbrial protein [Pseudomonas chlororaphis]
MEISLCHFRIRFGLVFLALLATMPVSGADNMYFHGALVAEPCLIPPGEEVLELDFGTVIDKYLYLNQRTHGQRFQLHLAECDPSISKTVSVTFTGSESVELSGLLALDPTSQASGIAIGIETLEGRTLPIGDSSRAYLLSSGDNLIEFKAYVRGEPTAIANRNIKRGPFRAVATFGLEYD